MLNSVLLAEEQAGFVPFEALQTHSPELEEVVRAQRHETVALRTRAVLDHFEDERLVQFGAQLGIAEVGSSQEVQMALVVAGQDVAVQDAQSVGPVFQLQLHLRCLFLSTEEQESSSLGLRASAAYKLPVVEGLHPLQLSSLVEVLQAGTESTDPLGQFLCGRLDGDRGVHIHRLLLAKDMTFLPKYLETLPQVFENVVQPVLVVPIEDLQWFGNLGILLTDFLFSDEGRSHQAFIRTYEVNQLLSALL